MPTELRLRLLAEKDIPLPKFTGYISRALLLNLLGQSSPSAAMCLHEPNKPKPYSVTPLFFKSKLKAEAGYLLDAAYPCEVAFRFLDEGLAKLALDCLLKKDRLLIIDVFLRIESMEAKHESYEDLEASAEPIEAFRLYFRTPTYFKELGSPFHGLFPEPKKVFPGLLKLWGRFSGRGAKPLSEYRAWIDGNLGISGYELATHRVLMGKKKALGFTGWASYKVRGEGDDWARLTWLMAKFAEYSNVGGNRTGGFGVVKFEPRPEQEAAARPEGVGQNTQP
ncbi:MAG: CRISPR-associated endoribonuclease Cas6 [Candidatus Bathyarchaeia archaeon]